MAAQAHRRGGGGNTAMAFLVGALLMAVVGLAWLAWSGGLFGAPDNTRVAMNLKIPEPQALPVPTPMPDPQPTPLPAPNPQPR